MTLEFEEKQFSDLSQIECRIYLSSSQDVKHRILRMEFSGQYRYGSGGRPDAEYMNALTTAALIAWTPDALVIDLSRLEYEWGDEMDWMLPDEAGEFGQEGIPATMVVGSRCKEGLRTLIFGINSNGILGELNWLHESLEDAVDYINGRLQNMNKR